MSPGARNAPDDDVVVDLLEQCLLRMQVEGSGVLDEMCRLHPEHAEDLRDGVRYLRQQAFVPDDLAGTPERLGEYRLLRRLGGGGMGVVYLAEQTTLGRQVAIKLIRPELVWFAGSRARFQREVEVIARLQHPGIVPVHAAGEESGIPYFAMDYVAGGSLAAVLAELAGRQPEHLGAPELAAALQRVAGLEQPPSLPFAGRWWQIVGAIVLQVANAVEHAHHRGVLHRDLKPSNVMLGRDGRVQLVDFGLARVDGDAALTHTGTPLGSLAYMAPEQVVGSELSVCTDVYGLGVTLYELLTLRCPFLADSSETTRARILAARVAPPRELLRSLPRDLETVCLKAMALEPQQRYARMADFARDLGNALVHAPIAARRAGPWLRLSRHARRHPARFALSVVVMIAAPTVAILTAVHFANRTTVDRGRKAEQAERVADLLLTGWTNYREAPQRARAAFDEVLRLQPEEPLAVVGRYLVARNGKDTASSAMLEVLAQHADVVAKYPMFALARQMADFDVLAPFPLPDDADIPATAIDWFLVGTAAMQRADLGDHGAYRRAMTCFDQAIQLSSTAEVVFYLRRCEALVSLGDEPGVRQAVQVLTTRWPVPFVLTFAGGALGSYDAATAQRWLEQSLALVPDQPTALAQLGRLRMTAGDKEGYVEALRRAVALCPEDAEILAELAKAQLLSQDLAGALASIEASTQLQDNVPDTYDTRGEILAAMGDTERALAAWAISEELAPARPWPYFGRGRCLTRLHRFEAAAVDLQKAIERDGRFAIFYGILAQACRGMQDWSGARAAARQAIELDAKEPNWLFELAFAEARSGELAIAMEHLAEVVRRLPADEQAHAMRMQVALDVGDAATRVAEEARWQQMRKGK